MVMGKIVPRVTTDVTKNRRLIQKWRIQDDLTCDYGVKKHKRYIIRI